MCCVNKVSRKFCPDTDAVPLFIAVVTLKKLKNFWILVFISFVTNSVNTLSKADGLKQSVKAASKQFTKLFFKLSSAVNKLGGFLYKRRSILLQHPRPVEMGPILHGEST